MSLQQKRIASPNRIVKDEIVFLGTGYISMQALAYIERVFSLEAIITKSDRVSSTGKKRPTAVKKYGQENNIPVFDADTADSLNELIVKNSFQSKLALVIDYGVIIPENVINYFPFGIINSHFSLLPKYRGPDPIRSAILGGDNETGVSLIKITPRLDDGPLIGQSVVGISPEDNFTSLTNKLITANGKLLTDILPFYLNEGVEIVPQNESQATYTSKVMKSDGYIEWTKTAAQIEREIRAFIEWPKSYTKIADKDVVVTQARAARESSGSSPGHTDFDQQKGVIKVTTGKGTLYINRLKPANKQEMSAAEFIRGYVKAR